MDRTNRSPAFKSMIVQSTLLGFPLRKIRARKVAGFISVASGKSEGLRVQPVTATPLVVYRQAFQSPRSFEVVG